MQDHGFAVGDHVVYPPHGAGEVTALQARGDDGVEYLSIEIAHSKMTLMVPAAAAAAKGVRHVVDPGTMATLMSSLADEGATLSDNIQQRAREVAERAKKGEAPTLASVIRDLNGRITQGKKLTAPEQKTFDAAKQHLASELVFVDGIPVDAAMAKIEQKLAEAASAN